MQSVYFYNVRKDFIGLFIVCASIVCILVGGFKISGINYNIVSAIGHLLLGLNFSRIFWYKNIIQYNNIGGVIRINSLLGKSFKFKNISGIGLEDNKLIISNYNNKKVIVNLSGVSKNDIENIISLFNTHIISEE